MTSWRFKCPHGHTSIEAIDGHFWCRTCERSEYIDTDGSYDEIRDTERDQVLDREELAQLREQQRGRAAGG